MKRGSTVICSNHLLQAGVEAFGVFVQIATLKATLQQQQTEQERLDVFLDRAKKIGNGVSNFFQEINNYDSCQLSQPKVRKRRYQLA